MRGNNLEKSHIEILESETLSRESRITESAQEIDDSIPCKVSTIDLCLPFVKSCILLVGGCFTRKWEVSGVLSDCEELVWVTQYVCVVVFSYGVLLQLFQKLLD